MSDGHSEEEMEMERGHAESERHCMQITGNMEAQMKMTWKRTGEGEFMERNRDVVPDTLHQA